MGKGYLIDTNVVIDFCNGKITKSGKDFLMFLKPEISVITNIELFASKHISISEYELLLKFVSMCTIHPVNIDLVQAITQIRQNYKTKLPDAIIAATAIKHNLVLLTRNIADFKSIKSLNVIDPNSIAVT